MKSKSAPALTWIDHDRVRRKDAAIAARGNELSSGTASYEVTLKRYNGGPQQSTSNLPQPAGFGSAFIDEDPGSTLARMWATQPPSSDAYLASIRQRRKAADRARHARERRAARASMDELLIAASLSESSEGAAQYFALQTDIAAERAIAASAHAARLAKANAAEVRRGTAARQAVRAAAAQTNALAAVAEAASAVPRAVPTYAPPVLQAP